MDDQTSFEPRPVLAPLRADRNRLAVLLPAAAFAAVAWAGLSGRAQDADQAVAALATSEPVAPTALVATSHFSAAQLASTDFPTQAVGLTVQRLADLHPEWLSKDDEVAVSGWYVATAVSNCPPLPAIYRPGSLPELRGDADRATFCDRSGVLYASRPLHDSPYMNRPEASPSASMAIPAVGAAVVIGVILPPDLEIVGAAATPVVVIGRFAGQDASCRGPVGCPRRLTIDHVAWAAGVSSTIVLGDPSSSTPGLPRIPADGTNLLTGG